MTQKSDSSEGTIANAIIHENDNYIVEIADVDGERTYQVRNKLTDVIERTDPVWPSVVQAADFFDEAIKTYEDEKEGAPIDMAGVIPLHTLN